MGLSGEKKAKAWCIYLSASDKDGEVHLRKAHRPHQSWLGLPLSFLPQRFLLNRSHWKLSYALGEESSLTWLVVIVRLPSWMLVNHLNAQSVSEVC